MRKGMWSVAALVLALSAAGVVFGGPGARAADATVRMVEGSPSDYKTWKFDPVEVTVSVGSTVTWRNEGSQPHDARTDNQEFSPLLDKGEEHKFTFNAPGRYEYYCKPHRELGMTGVVIVTGGATPTTGATTPTTQPGQATTTTTAKAGPAAAASTTTTTVKNGAAATTTTAPAAGATTTTLAPSATPTNAPEPAAAATGETTTTTAAQAGGEEAAADHAGEGGQEKKEKKKNSPIGIAFALVSTVLLAAICGKLLASKP